jgi:hypothetical protein
VNSSNVAQSGTRSTEGGDAGEEILAVEDHQCRRRHDRIRDGLELLSAGDLPPDIVALLKDAKVEIIACLSMERRMINHWVAADLIASIGQRSIALPASIASSSDKTGSTSRTERREPESIVPSDIGRGRMAMSGRRSADRDPWRDVARAFEEMKRMAKRERSQ